MLIEITLTNEQKKLNLFIISIFFGIVLLLRLTLITNGLKITCAVLVQLGLLIQILYLEFRVRSH